MREINFDSLQRKIISTAFILGICGGLFLSAMKSFESHYTLLELYIYLLILIVLGYVIGITARHYSISETIKLIKVDDNGEFKISEQKILFLALLVMIVAHFANSQLNEWNQFSAVLITGGVFILALINGIYDLSAISSKNILILGFVPVALSFIVGYLAVGSIGIINSVWIFGFMSLLSFLLLLSNLQLTSNLFASKDINIANTKKIKRYNFSAVAVFFILCVIVINFRKIIAFSWKIIVKLLEWVFVVLEKFTIWLFNDPQPGEPSGSLRTPPPESTFEYSDKPILEMILVIVIIAVLLALVFSIILVIKRGIGKQKVDRAKYTYDEFDEESDIVREARRLNLRKKFKYTLDELDGIGNQKEKIRYLYGYILERLYHYKIDITKSDTPEEIIHKILLYENGQELSEKGFGELTEAYRKVRYGNKNVDLSTEIHQLGKVMEDAIKNIAVEPSYNDK